MGYRQRLEAAIERARGQIADPEALDRTLTRLVDDGHVPPARAAALRAELPAHLERSGYVLGHLGAHLVAGARPGVRRLARWLVPACGAADQGR